MRADELIRTLGLAPHPEGGWFREVFRSAHEVQPGDDRGRRAALTTIYFLLCAGQHSRWHRVRSDEVWHFYEGEPLVLWCAAGDFSHVERIELGPVSAAARPVFTVPAGCWQAARPQGAYSLVGCTVGPGFEFADFAFLQQDATALQALDDRQPSLGDLL